MTTEDVRRVIGMAVYLRTSTPHKGEFHWIIFERATARVLAEGYCQTLNRAMAAGEIQRQLVAMRPAN